MRGEAEPADSGAKPARDVCGFEGIWVSMDGKGRWMDNVFVERLWRSLKHEEVYLKSHGTVGEARKGIGGWIERYNTWRRHAELGTAPRRRPISKSGKTNALRHDPAEHNDYPHLTAEQKNLRTLPPGLDRDRVGVPILLPFCCRKKTENGLFR